AHAAEVLRDGDDAFDAWLAHDYGLNESASAALARYVHQQETVSEIPTLSALSIECISMQACTEYFVHTPLPRSANETLARVLIQRWQRTNEFPALALAADLGFYLLVSSAEAISAARWRAALTPARFADDFHEHLHASDLL